jgi:hypothetical protein
VAVGALALVLLGSCPFPSRAEGPGRAKVLGLSLLVPGLGHQVLGSTTKAHALMAAEGAIWGTFGVFQLQGHARKDSYVEMAELFAGVPDANDRPGEYYRRLGRYFSSEEYDDEIRRDARARFPDDLAAREDYFERNRVPSDQVWLWSSLADWKGYQNKRNDSNRAFKRGRYMLGVAVANRLLAAVDAMRIVHRGGSAGRMSFSLVPDPEDPREPARFCVTVDLP